jgi:hypothetical protein
MYKLFLDDIREPQDAVLVDSMKMLLHESETMNHEWIITRSYKEFIDILKERGLPEEVSFDHDLTIDHMKHYIKNSDKNVLNYNDIKMCDTGYHCAKAFVEAWKYSGEPLVKVYIHTANHIGAENIKTVLKDIINKSGV